MKDVKYVLNRGLAFSEDRDMQNFSDYAKEGWFLESFAFLGFGYKLRKGTPKKLIYSLDYRKDADDEYFSLFKASGWSLVCSEAHIHIFSAPVGTKPIYTDQDTLIEKYEQEKNTMGRYALTFLLAAIAFFLIYGLNDWITLPLWASKIFLILGVLSIIPLVFTGLPYCQYLRKSKYLQK
jgi:hypothetical protein